MTEAEEQQLRALGADLAGANQSPWEPRCVALAFASTRPGNPLVLTMQTWIDLDAIRSPLLVRGAFASVEQLADSAAIFGLKVMNLSPEKAVDVTVTMRAAVENAFAMALPMQRRGAVMNAGPDGFGSWLPLRAFLEVECGKSRAEAAEYPVGEAFALMAAARRNEGWEPKGETYAQRDVIEKEDSDA